MGPVSEKKESAFVTQGGRGKGGDSYLPWQPAKGCLSFISSVFLLLLLRTVSLLTLPGRGLLPLSLPPCLLSTLLPSTYPSL